MRNQLFSILQAWKTSQFDTEWVLGTVYRTEGSAYRKAGAQMLINGKGQQFGLLSGGCIEADIVRNARKAIVTNKIVTLAYDGNDEDDLSFKLGIGCGGVVHIVLHPINASDDLGLSDIYAALVKRESGYHHLKIGEKIGYFRPSFVDFHDQAYIESNTDGEWLVTPIRPEPHILVVGGGQDALPVSNIAHNLGWKITIADPRPSNARSDYFPHASAILRKVDQSLAHYVHEFRVDAAILMSHSMTIDASALAALFSTPIRHLSMLGPRHRFMDVLSISGLSEEKFDFKLSSPAGLDIGGSLPESIALSILSEIHATLYRNPSPNSI